MQTETFKVQNVKCGGCVKTIVDGLSAFTQVNSVTVTVEDGSINVTGDGFTRQELATRLVELGYPETTN